MASSASMSARHSEADVFIRFQPSTIRAASDVTLAAPAIHMATSTWSASFEAGDKLRPAGDADISASDEDRGLTSASSSPTIGVPLGQPVSSVQRADDGGGAAAFRQALLRLSADVAGYRTLDELCASLATHLRHVVPF